MSPKREPVTEDRLGNSKYFGKVLPLLDRLHDAGTGLDPQTNRKAHFWALEPELAGFVEAI